MLYLETTGNSTLGIEHVLINGVADHPAASYNSTTATLIYTSMPTPSQMSIESMTSNVLTASTAVNVTIVFVQSTPELGELYTPRSQRPM